MCQRLPQSNDGIRRDFRHPKAGATRAGATMTGYTLRQFQR